ncbi:MAG: T9SS type A sorting domain-containing protein, partial [Saprospiraceae bacterium]|nr:T9SS type A sorting domain-containing protein [Saprospiraceae bacterium]
GATTVTFTVTSDCENPVSCNATFTVTNAPAVVITCPANQTEPACQTQTDIDSKFNSWKNSASFTGGCGGLLTNSGGTAPDKCGGATTVTFTLTSDCETPKSCSATFTVDPAPAIVITCPANQTEPACQTQTDIDSKFNSWKNSASFTGGCGGMLTNNSGSTPNHCGGSANITFTVTSDCANPVTCNSTFTVTNAPAVVITCPANQTEPACQTQAAIDNAFNTWKNSATFSGGCSGVLTNNSGSTPSHCGGSANVTFTVNSDCENPVTCNSTFTVTNAPVVVITCPANQTEPACQSQADIDSKFNTWKNTASFSGGCNGVLTNNSGTAPSHCGGSETVTFTVTSDCELKTCSSTFTVSNPTNITINCPSNLTEPACQTQAAIDNAFNTWKNSASFSGGCNGTLTNSGGTAPDNCGGTTTVTFTVTSDCENPVTCNSTFTVTNAPAVVITCPANQTEPACQTQVAIDNAFNSWKNTASFSGGCGGMLTNSGGTAPDNCGGATTVTFTVTSDCENPVTCNSTFTVTNAPAVIITCPANQTELACQTQAAIDNAFNTWKNSASFSGGCGGVLSNSGGTAPDKCGGATTVTFTVTSDCENPVICNSTFTVTNAPAVVITCPANQTEPACQTQVAIDNAFNTWKNSVSFSGGCGGLLTNSGGTAPDKCGGATTVTFTVTSDCENPVTCNSTFTVTNAPAVVITCPANQTEPACQTQVAIDNAFNTWKNSASFSGGCGGVLTNNSGPAPNHCGGSANVTFTITSDCENPVSCNSTFTVNNAPAVVITCPVNLTESACQTQADIDSKFNAWKNSASFSGGCNGILTNNSGSAPSHCGGSTNVTFTLTSDCEAPKSCTASFTVNTAPLINLTCPSNTTEVACQTQAAIDIAFNNWKNTFAFSGGCNGVKSNDGTTAPNACGGTSTVTFSVTSDCEPVRTCSASFIVNNAPALTLICPVPKTEVACQAQSAINISFTAWKNTFSFTGGCNTVSSDNGTSAPAACGGSTTVTFTVTSSCGTSASCSSTFSVDLAPNVTLNCPVAKTEVACQTQSAIDASFNTWKNTASFSGGCNGSLSNSGLIAPSACGGSTTLTFTVTSNCEPPKTCNSTFTVTNAPIVVLNCPANVTELSCQTQASIDTKFETWKNSVSFSGGCNSILTDSGGNAPSFCGGSTIVTYTVNSDCSTPTTCTAMFTVTDAPLIVLNCPSNSIEAACQSQTEIDNKFNTWKNSVSFTGGCSGILSNSGENAPNACGGSVTITFTVSSDCESEKTCASTFTVNNAPSVILTCPQSQTESTCQTQTSIDSKYATWINSLLVSGGCNTVVTNNSPGAPNFCGGTSTVTFTVTSSCESSTSCVSTFSVLQAPAANISCPNNVTEASCQTQASIDSKFGAWINSASFSGGCSPVLSNNNSGNPNACGDFKSVMFTLTSSCENPKTCVATFTVTNAPTLSVTCPANSIQTECQTQDSINSKYSNWLNSISTNGGCNVSISNNSANNNPDACGEVREITFTISSTCESQKTCVSSFTVNAPSPMNLSCPVNKSITGCNTQNEVNLEFQNWLATVSVTGGCSPTITNNNNGAPGSCGGTKSVEFTASSLCASSTKCTASFTVLSLNSPTIICPSNKIINCNASTLPTNTGFATGIDDCNGTPGFTYSDQVDKGTCKNNFTIVRTWVATDLCGNSSNCEQEITVQDTFDPTFTIPADITIYKENIPAATRLLVNYNFNKGNYYSALEPYLYTQINCKIDTSSTAFKRDSGVVTGGMAFANNNSAGNALRVDNSKIAGYWQFNISGMNLPTFSNFEVYVQSLRFSNGSAKDLLMDYSLDGNNWTTFNSTLLTKGAWKECKGTIPGVSNQTNLYVRIKWANGNDSISKELMIDNFQIQGFREASSCDFTDTPDKTGYPDNVSDLCDPNPSFNYSDSLSTGSCLSKVFRTWTVYDDCGNKTTSGIKQVISIVDTTGPTLTCPAAFNIRKADSLVCYWKADSTLDVKAIDGCTGDSVTITNSYNNKSSLKNEQIPWAVAPISITWTATDQCGNTSTCKYLLKINEIEPPKARCKDDTIILDNSGKFTLEADSVDNGSSDNCQIVLKKLERKFFDCDDIPGRTIKFIVKDSAQLSDSCLVKLTILDLTPPVLNCKNITISVPATGNKKITADSVLLTSSDNCGIVTKTVTPDTFNCKSPKITTVTVKATDKNGNMSTCTATVTISGGDGDCDGVLDACDQCPRTDDKIDNDGDGKPDCNNLPATFAKVYTPWKCNLTNRVYISEINNGVCTTKCISYTTFKNTRTSKQWLGICTMCSNNLSGHPEKEIPNDVSLDDVTSKDIDGDFSIVPNPNYGNFDIVFKNQIENGTIEIINILEQSVWKQNINIPTNRLKISTSEFSQSASGMFWVIFRNENSKIIQPLIINK